MVSQEVWAALIAREDGQCQNCGATENVMPCHLTPVSRGGPDTLENLWLGCFSCHRQQHDHYLLVRRIDGHFYFRKV